MLDLSEFGKLSPFCCFKIFNYFIESAFLKNEVKSQSFEQALVSSRDRNWCTLIAKDSVSGIRKSTVYFSFI